MEVIRTAANTSTANGSEPVVIVKPITVYVSSERGQKTNTSYPFSGEIKSIEDMRNAVVYDHVCAKYGDGKNNRGRLIRAYRSKKTFKSSNCLPMDCDNCSSNPLDDDVPESNWKTPADVREAFPDVPFYVVYSRNHMKTKDGKAARPRFHVYFPMNEESDLGKYEKLKTKVQRRFKAFDDNAIDGARFFFGVEDPKVEYFAGDTLIDEFLSNSSTLPAVIPSGSRNSTLLSYADKVLKRFGDTEQARASFDDAAKRCDDPLDDDELKQIWKNAVKFFHNDVESDPEYVDPEIYARIGRSGNTKFLTSDHIKDALAEMGIFIRLNVITGELDIHGMPAQFSKTNAPNVLPTMIQDYFAEMEVKVARQVIDDCLVLIQDENRFNPVEEMLKSAEWDGTDRITEMCDILGISHNPDYVLYLTKWLHQCVAMALNSDEEPYGADGVLVIQADQGMGKTLFCRKIAMKSDWFAEGVSIDTDKKDSIIQSTGVWIAELGELDSTLKREQSALKAFLTAAKDTYRQPYARAAVKKPRRTSFAATVNPKEFLNDETGSRRYWVIHPDHINLAAMKGLSKEWLTQLWIQVYSTLYLVDPQGFRLTDDERDRLQQQNEEYSKPMPGEIELFDRLHWEVPVEKWNWKKISEIIRDLDLRNVSASQMGKLMTKIAARDKRVAMKTPHNVKHYLLPPMWIHEFTDEDAPALV